MRYHPSYYETRLDRVPGAVLKRGTPSGPPRNCRMLLKNPPPAPAIAEPWLDPPPELQDWVVDWLTPYQKEAWGFAQNRTGTLFYHPPGAGKTAAGICAALTTCQGGKIIVVTRATTRRQWQREVQRLTTLRPQILQGKSAKMIDPKQRCVILGWETLSSWVGTLIAWCGSRPYTVVLDEIHKAKSWKRKEKIVRKAGVVGRIDAKNISASAAKIARGAKARLGLSATPAPNSLSDLWSVLDILEPGEWGSSWDWMMRYCAAHPGQYGGLDASGRSNTEEFKARFQEMAHRVNAKEVFENLPPKRRELCYLSKEDQSKPVGFMQELKAAARKGRNALFETQLLEAAARKRQWVVETVEDCVAAGQKVVVFTGRKRDCEAIATSLEKRLKKLPDTKLWWGHGGISTKERDQMVQDYSERPDRAVFVGTTDAFGEAIDGLQHTDVAICCLLPWNGGRVEQMEGRFYRKSSTRSVRVLYVIAEGTVDEHVSELVLTKLNNIEKALDHTEARDIANTLAGLDDEDAIIESIINKMGT